MADNNYDIWIPNQRGNVYSHKHLTFSSEPTNYRFWNFSVHELGTKDLPSILDYVRTVTGYEKVLFVGHSLGTTSFLILCSEMPNYCSRIEAAVFLAPVAYPPETIRQPTVRLIIKWAQNIAHSLRGLGNYEFLGRNHSFVNSILNVCTISENLLCQAVLKFVFNFDRQRQEALTQPLTTYLSSSLGGTSVKLFEHISSMISPNGRFSPYEYSRKFHESRIEYLEASQKDYFIENITTPIAIFYAEDDIFVDKKSVKTLKSKLKNVLLDKIVSPPFFHLGFMYSLKTHYHIVEDILSFFHQIAKLD